MKKLVFLLYLISFSSLTNCNSDPDLMEPGKIARCQSDFSSMAFTEADHAYTGDTLTVQAKSFCEDIDYTLLIGDMEIAEAGREDSTLLFWVIPKGMKGLFSVSLQSSDTSIFLSELVIYPGGGKWVEAASFPGPGRGGMLCVTDGTQGLAMGGNAFEGYNKTGDLEFSYLKDLYAYNASSDTWSLISDDADSVRYLHACYFDGDIFMLTDGRGRERVERFNLASLSYRVSVSSLASLEASNVYLFSDQSRIYASVIRSSGLSIYYYNKSTDTWDIISTNEHPLTGDNWVSFAAVKDKRVLLGYRRIPSRGISTVIFDLETKELLTGAAETSVTTKVSGGLKYLFTVDYQAYFIEQRGGGISPSEGTSVDTPAPILYQYNMETNRWRSTPHQFPETFFLGVNFELENRGFAGLSAKADGLLFEYSQDFFEFIPE